MNHIYRTIWNEKTGTCLVVSELAKSSGKKVSAVCGGVAGVGPTFKPIAASLLMAFAMPLWALPNDGVVTAGSATISSGPDNMTINQSSQNVALNWQSFSIGQGEAVRFVQPNSNSVALNRVVGADPSSILGSLSANGQVFLVNPNGVMFGQGASVNVGGLVASTLNISDADFMAGEYTFTGASDAAVLNQGQINADGGYVALLGTNVSNQGVISARLGTVTLAAGEAITLDMIGDGLVTVSIDQGAVDALVANGGMIQADGGQVLMSAQSAGNLLNTVVNNTGVVQAQTIENRNGVIRLLGDMETGTVNVAGTLDASAPDGGDGGFVETSAANVQVSDNARITTKAADGQTGTWLIDPSDYNIAATGGDITGATLSANLANTDIIIESVSGASGTAGDVNVDDTVSWSANKLTLSAQNDININTEMHGSGTASLALEYGQSAVAAGNTSTVNVNAPVNLAAGENFSTRQGSDGATVNYTVITSLGEAGSVTATDLQGMNGNLAGNYVLGSDIDASATSGWNGHTINNLTINLPANDYVGLFGQASGAEIRNVGLLGGDVTGLNYVGGLVGHNSSGTITRAYATGTVTGGLAVGGL
ncbi:filamentous hemagglutinin N-terminal domain-containing protein, partial [uncultured Marinobacter sp.]|uniref:two-partner secretion domain-containing protein n=1 Tax=uncultured Marinobacter sp. TaxID=187379 RepID=UPI0030D9ACD7